MPGSNGFCGFRYGPEPQMNADAHPRFVKVVLQTGFQDCSCLKSYATTKSVRIRNMLAPSLSKEGYYGMQKRTEP